MSGDTHLSFLPKTLSLDYLLSRFLENRTMSHIVRKPTFLPALKGWLPSGYLFPYNFDIIMNIWIRIVSFTFLQIFRCSYSTRSSLFFDYAHVVWLSIDWVSAGLHLCSPGALRLLFIVVSFLTTPRPPGDCWYCGVFVSPLEVQPWRRKTLGTWIHGEPIDPNTGLCPGKEILQLQCLGNFEIVLQWGAAFV